MNAALFSGVLFPPPASSACVFTRLNRPRARSTADARVTRGVERMHRHVVLPDIITHLRGSPIGQRIQLQFSVDLLHLAHIHPRIILFAPQPSHPRAQPAQSALERPDLTNLAAEIPQRNLTIEQVGTVPGPPGL